MKAGASQRSRSRPTPVSGRASSCGAPCGRPTRRTASVSSAVGDGARSSARASACFSRCTLGHGVSSAALDRPYSRGRAPAAPLARSSAHHQCPAGSVAGQQIERVVAARRRLAPEVGHGRRARPATPARSRRAKAPSPCGAAGRAHWSASPCGPGAQSPSRCRRPAGHGRRAAARLVRLGLPPVERGGGAVQKLVAVGRDHQRVAWVLVERQRDQAHGTNTSTCRSPTIQAASRRASLRARCRAATRRSTPSALGVGLHQGQQTRSSPSARRLSVHTRPGHRRPPSGMQRADRGDHRRGIGRPHAVIDEDLCSAGAHAGRFERHGVGLLRRAAATGRRQRPGAACRPRAPPA